MWELRPISRATTGAGRIVQIVVDTEGIRTHISCSYSRRSRHQTRRAHQRVTGEHFPIPTKCFSLLLPSCFTQTLSRKLEQKAPTQFKHTFFKYLTMFNSNSHQTNSTVTRDSSEGSEQQYISKEGCDILALPHTSIHVCLPSNPIPYCCVLII